MLISNMTLLYLELNAFKINFTHTKKEFGYLIYFIHFLNIFALIMHLEDNQKTKSDFLTLHDPLLFIRFVVSNSL